MAIGYSSSGLTFRLPSLTVDSVERTASVLALSRRPHTLLQPAGRHRDRARSACLPQSTLL